MWGNWWGVVGLKKRGRVALLLSFTPPRPPPPLCQPNIKPLHPTTVQACSHTHNINASPRATFTDYTVKWTRNPLQGGLQAVSLYVSDKLKNNACELVPKKSFWTWLTGGFWQWVHRCLVDMSVFRSEWKLLSRLRLQRRQSFAARCFIFQVTRFFKLHELHL